MKEDIMNRMTGDIMKEDIMNKRLWTIKSHICGWKELYFIHKFNTTMLQPSI